MSAYTTMKIKPNQLSHYNNLMYNNMIFKLDRVNVKDLFNNEKNEKIFHENIQKLNGTDRNAMLEELSTLQRLLSSYATNRPKFNLEEFGEAANYEITVVEMGNIPMYTFSTKNTRLRVITVVDILGKFDSSKYVSDRVREAYVALEGFKKLGKASKNDK